MLDIQNLSKTFNPGTVNEKKALSSLSLHLDGDSGDAGRRKFPLH